MNDVQLDGSFRGVHLYRGVPLRTLLDQVHIAKNETVFSRETDLAVVIRNRNAEQVVLSWGELYYGNLADVILAYSSTPKMPHKTCRSCHAPAVYQDRMNQMTRPISFPKLVIAKDRWSDRCIEEVVGIEVCDLGQKVGVFLPREKKPKKLYAKTVQIDEQQSRTTVELTDISQYPRVTASVVQAGDGTGYHGIQQFEGASLKEILLQNGIKPDPALAFVCSAPDGYRTLLSAGELFYGDGASVILADRHDGKPMADGGRFRVIPIDDLSADRWIKSVSRIDIVRARRNPKLFIIGVGPGDTGWITSNGISR